MRLPTECRQLPEIRITLHMRLTVGCRDALMGAFCRLCMQQQNSMWHFLPFAPHRNIGTGSKKQDKRTEYVGQRRRSMTERREGIGGVRGYGVDAD